MFALLHVHSEYSILDGATNVEKAVQKAAMDGRSGIAMTEHGSLASAYQLVKYANIYGIKPIIGCEFYVAPNDRTYKKPVFWGTPEQKRWDISGAGKYLHLTVLARNREGVLNLFRLQQEAYRTGFYGKARIDLRILSRYREGLIVLSGCLGGHIQTLLSLGRDQEALMVAAHLKARFGENFFIEVSDHEIPQEYTNTKKLLRIAERLNVKIVATSDTHYLNFTDSFAHDCLLCIQTKAKLADNNRFKFEGFRHHLYDYQGDFGDLPLIAIQNTNLVAGMVEDYGDLFKPKLRLPKVLGVEDEVAELNRLVQTGLVELGGTRDHYAQCEYEAGVISASGYAGYFVALNRAMALGRQHHIRFGPARGSAAGATTSWTLRISQVDPIRWGLLFERFLNPERLSMPDIDIDVDERKRDQFLDLVRKEFGDNNVAQIVTFGTIGAKSAIRDVCRISGRPSKEADAIISELPPPRFGRAPSLADLPQKAKQTYREILEVAEKIEGTIRSAGVHPSGVIISPEPLTNIVPLKRPSGKGGWVVEVTGVEADELGLVKYDFLGLTTVSVIDRTLELAGVSLPEDFDDRITYELLERGDTTGVFQLESTGMRRLLRKVRPRTLTDVASVLALYRPGPMGVGSHTEYADRKNGRSPISYPHHEFERVLSDALSETHGIIVFQEQVLEVLKLVGGYTYGSAELIFNAMRKKDTAKMQAAFPEFHSRLNENGYSEEAINALWETLVPFSDYSFNKSHSISYAILSYWTAYLKAHYPKEFYAALLSAEDQPDKKVEYIRSIMEGDILLLPPDINESGLSWTPTDKGLRFGLGAIRGISESTATKISGSGPFRTMTEWWEKCPKLCLNLNTLLPLIRAGCFDALEPNREGLFMAAEGLAARAADIRELPKNSRLYTSFDFPPKPFSAELRKSWENEVLGVSLTQASLRMVRTRRLDVDEWRYVAQTLATSPGRTPVDIRISASTTLRQYAKVTVTEQLLGALRAMGVVVEETS